MQFVISDAPEGLKPATAKVSWARSGNVAVFTSRAIFLRAREQGQQPVVHAVVKTAFAEKDCDQAPARWREVADSLQDRFCDVAEFKDEAEHDVLAYMVWTSMKALAPDCRGPIHWSASTRKIKRHTNVVGIFPDREAVIRLVGRLCSSRTTNGPSRGATCRSKS